MINISASRLNFLKSSTCVLNRIYPLFILLFLFTTIVKANPVDPKTLLSVSELYIQSPTEWYIEMDIDNYWCNFPCTTSAFRLKLSSLKDTCNLRLYVNNLGIAVITPNSIRGLPLNSVISLKTSDSVSISDTSKSYRCHWKFIVPQIQRGFSLINVTQGSPTQTDRVTIGFRGNPPDNYRRFFISEASVISSKNWALELDLQQTDIPLSVATGNATSRFRIQLSNSSTVYSVNARFDTNGIAVLRPGDIYTSTDTLKELPIPTLVKLLDTCWNSTYRSGLYWWFSIQETTDSAHSLIQYGTRQTVRTSIGRRITYSTSHKIHLFDHTMNPLSNINVYYPQLERNPYFPFDYIYYECLRLLKTETGTFTTIEVDINSQKNWFGFTLDPIISNYCTEKSKFTGISWTGQYIDSMPEVSDTLIFPVTAANSVATHPRATYKLIHVNSNRQRSLFSSVLPANASNAHVKILTLEGKLITKLSFGSVLSAGTYSCQWIHSPSSVPAGTYLCVLVADGVEVKPIKITIR